MSNNAENRDTRELYAKILDLTNRNNMTRAQIAVRLNLDIEQIDRALIHDRTHQNRNDFTEADLAYIFAV